MGLWCVRGGFGFWCALVGLPIVGLFVRFAFETCLWFGFVGGGWFSEFGCLILLWCCAGWDVCAGVWDCGLMFPGFEFVCRW